MVRILIRKKIKGGAHQNVENDLDFGLTWTALILASDHSNRWIINSMTAHTWLAPGAKPNVRTITLHGRATSLQPYKNTTLSTLFFLTINITILIDTKSQNFLIFLIQDFNVFVSFQDILFY